jgi:hypothetical protein
MKSSEFGTPTLCFGLCENAQTTKRNQSTIIHSSREFSKPERAKNTPLDTGLQPIQWHFSQAKNNEKKAKIKRPAALNYPQNV